MVKNRLKLLLFLLFPLTVTAQKKIDFKDSMDEAIKLSERKNKPILLVIEPPNRKIESIVGLADPEIISSINEHFISFRTTMGDTDAKAITSRYPDINKYPAFVFLHADKEMFFNGYGSWVAKATYQKLIDDALIAAKQKTLSAYENEYLSNKNDKNILKAFILARQKQGITNNADLIERYAALLTNADFNDRATVLFVLKAGPYADGNAYKLAYANRKIVDSIYKIEPVEVRVAITKNIFTNTMIHAKETKNFKQAQRAASFSSSTSGSDQQTRTKYYNAQLLSYYFAVSDTSNYLRNAVSYYDTYFMNLSADSIKKLEVKQQQASFNRNRPKTNPSTLTKAQIDSLKASPNTTVRQQTFATQVPNMANAYANALNDAAYKFYETGTTNINYLTKAMIWSRRSIELNPASSSYHNTLAHILYRLGYYAEAVKTQEAAISHAKVEGSSYDTLQEELKKMKSRKI